MILSQLDQFLASLSQQGRERKIPNVTPANARFLHDSILATRPKHILEIGTANGLSTLWLARALQLNARLGFSGIIHTCEFSVPAHQEACEYFKQTQLEEYIVPHLGNALTIIPQIEASFDWIFIDGHKKDTLDFFCAAYAKANPGALIIVDDVIKYGHKMQNFYEFLAKNAISYTLLPIDSDDGVMMIVKSPEYPSNFTSFLW
jgi:predicted O-methyltransferase YrrM